MVSDIPAGDGNIEKLFFTVIGSMILLFAILLTCGGEEICRLRQETEDTKRHPAKKKKNIKFRRKTFKTLLSE
jgi:hypothetical protein